MDALKQRQSKRRRYGRTFAMMRRLIEQAHGRPREDPQFSFDFDPLSSFRISLAA